MSTKILLCISNTGGGHRSAARAIREAIGELVGKQQLPKNSVEVQIVDVVEESHIIHRLFVGIYNYLLRYRQDWMKYYYSLIELVKPDNSGFGYWLSSGYLQKLLHAIRPSIVVSLHPMANHYLARALITANLPEKPKLLVVVTDPNANLWSGWACRNADLIVAPNETAHRRLQLLGVDATKIVTIGMPVEPEFLKPPLQTRSELLAELDLKTNAVTICLTAGYAGGGNISKIYQAMAEVDRPMQVVVICGNNRRLVADIKKQAVHMPFSTAVVPILPTLSDIMSASDLLVTKAGGLTTYEAVARRLPLAIDMISEPMPQESGTAEMLIEADLARAIKEPSDIVAIVRSIKHIEERESLALPTKYNLDRTHAAYEIARSYYGFLGVKRTKLVSTSEFRLEQVIRPLFLFQRKVGHTWANTPTTYSSEL